MPAFVLDFKRRGHRMSYHCETWLQRMYAAQIGIHAHDTRAVEQHILHGLANAELNPVLQFRLGQCSLIGRAGFHHRHLVRLIQSRRLHSSFRSAERHSTEQ